MSSWRPVLREAAILPVHLYRLLLSPILPRSCRFEPTCSQYAMEAVREHGVFRGARMTILRVLRCHPYSAGGWDPVQKLRRS